MKKKIEKAVDAITGDNGDGNILSYEIDVPDEEPKADDEGKTDGE